MKDFNYLSEKDVYLDAACQSLRPAPVIAALKDYYENYNACGERAKYKWGKQIDEKVLATRKQVLKYLKVKQKDYFVSFTLNTSYGLNLLLAQIHPRFVKKVITSEIEHNSVFLSTMSYAKQHNLKRIVLKRNPDGSIPLKGQDFHKALVVVNCVGNFDGQQLKNLKQLVKLVRNQNGIIIIDAAQALGHNVPLLYHTHADAICTSAHKTYGPSLGVMVVRKDLIPQLRTTFIGGGMVDDVTRTGYTLSSKNPDHYHTLFEPGLQAWGEIVAFGAALGWLTKLPASRHQQLQEQSQKLYDFLKSRSKVHLINREPTPTISFYIEGMDSHLIGAALSDKHIMVRTGYFCAHYYLDHVKHYPPLVRCSLGLHTRPEDIDKLIKALEKVTK